MHRMALLIALVLTAPSLSPAAEAWERLVLRYDRPAGKWEEALPVGNGRLGAMVFGWARLEDGNHAQKMLRELIATSTLPNMLDSCPPFQIDGNFGGTASLGEMLLQSHAGEVALLPALPDAWAQGCVRGLRARGGLEVDIAWQRGRSVSAVVKAARDSRPKIRPPRAQRIVGVRSAGQAVPVKAEPNGTFSFAVTAGGRYELGFE